MNYEWLNQLWGILTQVAKSAETVIKYCNDNGVLDFGGIVLSSLIPIYIMKRTLKREKESAKQDAIEREKQYTESQNIAEARHIELLRTQNDINRISIMPYLFTKNDGTSVDTYRQNGRAVFDITFSNIGNGAAVELQLVYNSNGISPTSVGDSFSATYDCCHPFDEFTSVVQPNSTCRVSIMQTITKPDIHDGCDRFSFTVCYKDMRMYYYEQTFTVLFHEEDKAIKINRIDISSPECKKLLNTN